MPSRDEKQKIEQWLDQHQVQDVEVLVCDFAGISRGKVMPCNKFLEELGTNNLRLPESLFGMCVDGKFILNDHVTVLEEDAFLIPNLSTAGLIPWLERTTAFFMCDLLRSDGTPLQLAPRQVLTNVLTRYAEKGWKPIVAPEFEFSLFAKIEDAESGLPAPPIPPSGITGHSIAARGYFSPDGIAELSGFFDDVRRYCEAMGLPTDTAIVEAGVGQFEFNVAHDEALRMADIAVHFKRLVKWAAQKNGLRASFMAKPYSDDFGNSMHIHQSVIDSTTGVNIFADEDGQDTKLFHAHIAGLQKYAPEMMPFFAPYTNSYLRLGGQLASPVNTHWGVDNRSVGLRVPTGGQASRRIENRISGSDVNPYLAIAASLLCGYLGMVEELTPSNPISGSAYDHTSNRLPEHIRDSLEALERTEHPREILGDEFVRTFLDVKYAEIAARSNVLSPWDLDYLLPNI